jgi:hypothetical protein
MTIRNPENARDETGNLKPEEILEIHLSSRDALYQRPSNRGANHSSKGELLNPT